MPRIPPDIWAELFYDGAWRDVSRDVRAVQTVGVTRGLSSESAGEAEPVQGELSLNNRGRRYAPRDPASVIFGKGRNTPIRYGYHVGSPWAQSDGTGTNGMTTPHNAAFSVTDLDLRMDLALEDWTEQQGLASRWVAAGNNRSWGVYMGGTGLIGLVWSPTGTATTITRFSSVPVGAYNGQRLTIRITLDVDNGAGGYELRIYTGRTVDDTEWTLLGEPLTGTSTTSLYAATAGLEFGDHSGLVLNMLNGKAFALRLMTGINGTTATRMTTRDASPGASSFTSGGAAWTVVAPTVLTNKHTRMSGEVPEWPATRDRTGNDSVVSIAPAGVTRRMDAGTKPQDSALLRYIRDSNPIECWPLTDGPEARSGAALLGSRPAAPLEGSFGYSWGQGELAEWVEPVFRMNDSGGARMVVPLPSSGTADDGWSVDFSFSTVRSQFDLSAKEVGADATVRTWTISLIPSTNQIFLTAITLTGTTTVLDNAVVAVFGDDRPHHVRMTTADNSGSADYFVYVDGVLVISGNDTDPPVQLESLSALWGLGGTVTEMAFGYLTYWGNTAPTARSVYDALTGFQGERAGARIERLAAESGYTASTAGETAQQRRMGIQDRKKLLELLNEASKTNFGYLVEARDRNELIHRGHTTLWNQPPAFTLDFSAGLVQSYKCRDDDLLTENDVAVEREFGAVPSRQILESGDLSVQDYPNGVGRYDKEYTYSLHTDADAAHTASMRLHMGTYNGVRFTRLTLDLANERVFQMIDDILRADVGDMIRLTNLPTEHGPDDVDVLITGYTEAADDKQWRITFNCVPGQPWRALVAGSDVYSRLDTAGCELAENVDASETSVDVLTTAVKRWVDSATYPAEFPFDVRTGGEVMRVTACTGTTASQTFTVLRGVNGVVLEHSTGDAISLANPVYLTL
ncbi:hypothetical protein [Streptomyces gardneri]|uniref:hypothetical protein n=1 Tax=Streptomyces gardneri TaxID=66892 RepID=UPI0035D9417A